jgi:hypothetical protein
VLGVGERMEQLVHVGAAARGAGGVGDHEHQLRRSPFGKPRIRAGWPCRIPRCSRSNRWDSQARGRRGASGKGGEEGGDGPKGAAFRPRPWKGSSASFPRRLRARGSAEGGKASPRHCAANARLLAQSLRFGKLRVRTDTARGDHRYDAPCRGGQPFTPGSFLVVLRIDLCRIAIRRETG